MLCIFLLVDAVQANVPPGIDDLKAFQATAWSPPRFPALTNSPPHVLADEIQRFRESGGKGDPAALLTLAVLNERGIGLNKNLSEAAKLCQKAAETGFAPAQHQLGLYLSEGAGLTKDLKEALRWFGKAAAQGYAPAEYLLGYCHLNGESVETNHATANEWFQKAADHNYPPAIHNLAVSYARGRAVPTNVAEAIRLFRRAADLGSDTSGAAAAALLTEKEDPANLEEAVRLARRAAENGDTLGQRLMAELLMYGRGVRLDREEAVRWLQRAAGRGDWAADAKLGAFYLEGVGVKTNYAMALYWLEPAAKAGNAAAQSYLGLMYCDGKGVARNYARALELFRNSSTQGERLGWYNLGWLYAQGLGVPQDHALAYNYYRRSAELEWPAGQRMTGLCLYLGRGVQTNVDDAIQWLIKAAAHNENDAVKLLGDHLLARVLKTNVIDAVLAALTRAANSGSAEAAHLLGRVYVTGLHVPPDRARACEYFSQAATNGVLAAAVRIALTLFDATLGPPQPEEAWRWVEYAAERDDMHGIPMLASRYLSGLPEERNIEVGTNWLWRGIQKNQATSMTFLADLLFNGTLIPQDRAAALAWWKRSAELGHAPAQTLLAAQAFATPPGLPLQDALRYLELAAAQEWPAALTLLAYLYLEGKQVARDPIRGQLYLRRAAELKYPGAQYTLGVTFLQGQLGETNASAAAGLFRACAEQGYAAGQFAYGQMLSRGHGIQSDLVEAWKWLELAAAAREQSAQAAMDALRNRITPAQIEEAKQRARAFKPTFTQLQAYMSVPKPVPSPQTLRP